MNTDNFQLPEEWPGVHFMDEQEIREVNRVLNSRSLFRYYGPDLQFEAQQFEKELSQFLNVDYTLGVSSGSAALQVALAAIDVGPGDEVLVPGYLWIATVSAVIRVGAIPKLVDVDNTLSLQPQDLKRKISVRTKAVIMVHMGGVIGGIHSITEICKDHKLWLIEDCSQSLGATSGGKQGGTFGDVSTFSFQLNKNITSGEGGAIATNNRAVFEKAVAAHDLGYPRNESGRLQTDSAIKRWGVGSRMNEITAAILRVQLRKLPEIISNMKSFNLELREILQGRNIETRSLIDPTGITGGFLEIYLENNTKALIFKSELKSKLKTKEGSLYPILMNEWGLHIYYNITSLVDKVAFSGAYSVWDLNENSFAKKHSYIKGELPFLDGLVDRCVIFCIASKLTPDERAHIASVFDHTALRVSSL